MQDLSPFPITAASPLPKTGRPAATRHFPALFLSDLHLGSRACREEALHTFLRAHTADRIYLVGDILDTWTGVGTSWSLTQHAILHLLLERAQQGVRLIYTPGNHDAFFRNYIGQPLPGVEVVPHAIHQARDGRRYLVTHGDSCDEFGERYPLLARLGARIDVRFRGLLDRINRLRRRHGRADWTLAERVVKAVNDVVRSLDNFDLRLSDQAREHGADGVICGHFHKPDLHDDHGVIYANCGDWVENSTALVETDSGRLMLVDWAAHGQIGMARNRAPEFSVTANEV